MVDKTQLWTQILGALSAISANLSPAVIEKIEASSIELRNLFSLGVAYYVHPDPIMLKHLQQRNPYSSGQTQIDGIQKLRNANHLDENDVITQTAYDEYQGLIDVQDAQAKSLNLMDESELIQIADYLKRAHDAALELDAPSFHLVTSRPLPENTVHRIYYLIYRFTALRDDAHIQAWQGLGVDGHTYEASSLIWNETARNATKFMEVRGNRGYEESDWQNTLDSLVDKGWLLKDDDDYVASDDYKTIREEIEIKTDEFFYQIFTGFTDNEIENLLNLLQEIQEKFTPESLAT